MPGAGEPPFSVLITSSGPSLLRQALTAIRSQDYAGPIEIVAAGGERGDPSGEEQSACDDAHATYLETDGRGASWLAAARNRALEHCSGRVVLLLDGDTIPPPWHVTGCARALRNAGSYAIVCARRNGLPRVYQADHPAMGNLFGASPADTGAPELLQSKDRSASACGNLAFHRSLIDRGFRFDETVPEAAVDAEFACRLDDSGYRIDRIASWSCLQLAHPREPFRAELLVEAEHAFLKRHPHALLQGSCELALEPANGGLVSLLVNVRDGTPRHLKRSLSFVGNQAYRGEIEILVFAQQRLCSESLEVCRRNGVRHVIGPAAEADEGFLLNPAAPPSVVGTTPGLAASPGPPEFPSHAGASAAPSWQRALAAALPAVRGRYILYLEAGALLAPHHVQNCVNILRYQGDSLVCWGQALPLDQLLLFDTLTPFSRFHLTAEQARQLIGREDGVERIPVRSLQGMEPSEPDHLFLSREVAQRVGSQAAGAELLPVPLAPLPLTQAGARSVCLESLRAHRAPSRG